jgi:integrase/recombinase XerD
MTERQRITRQITNLCRQARLDYDALRQLFSDVRKALGLYRSSGSRHLPHLLPADSLRRFYEAIAAGGNAQHELMLKLLFYTAVRVSELISIKVSDVDLASGKIFIESGKGDKDRYILFPDSFRLALRTYLASPEQQDNKYLFESQRRTRYSRRRIGQIVAQYAEAAGLEERVHPHLFRHQMLTYLTAQGLPDSAIQLISGHASKKSLEVYQHLGLGEVREKYQEAVRKLEV